MCNGDAGGHSDGDLTAHSQHSQLSSRSYGKLPVTREHLTDMMVLGERQSIMICILSYCTLYSIVLGTGCSNGLVKGFH